MPSQEDLLATRLAAEDERSARQRRHFEEQRAWLLAQIKSLPSDGHPLVTTEPQPERQAPTSAQNRQGPVEHVEERLLAYGRQRQERLVRARQAQQKEKEEEEERRLLQQRPHSASTSSSRAVSVGGVDLLLRRAARQHQIVEESMSELTFRPRISAESARLAQERRTREHMDNVPVANALLLRQAAVDRRINELREANHNSSATPMITARAKRIKLPYTVSERLYLHAKERQQEDAALAEQLRELVEESVEFPFQPQISSRAERLRRQPGRSAHDDLYEDGMQRLQSPAPQNEDTAERFAPRIDRVSAMIAEHMAESTAERLLRPRRRPQSAQSFNSSAERRRGCSSETLRRRFDSLYEDSGARARRQQSREAAAAATELGPECTFAPKVNNTRPTHSSTSVLPIEERMRLWKERRDRRVAEARGRQELESAAVTHTTPCSANGGKRINGAGESVYDKQNEVTEENSSEHYDAIQMALLALKNAERVSQFIKAE